MADFEQIPGTLNVKVALGDDLVLPLQFSIALTGYTFVADMGGQTPAQDVSQLASGILTLTLTDTQIAALGEGSFEWSLQWTLAGASRTVLAGAFRVVNKLT